jgi:uncharacterized Zn-binding protein involved in type VI secretion
LFNLLVDKDTNDSGGVILHNPATHNIFIQGVPVAIAGDPVIYTNKSPGNIITNPIRKIFIKGIPVGSVGDVDTYSSVFSRSMNFKVFTRL